MPRASITTGSTAAKLGELARDAGFVDVEFRTAIDIVEEDRRFPVFLLLGRNP